MNELVIEPTQALKELPCSKEVQEIRAQALKGAIILINNQAAMFEDLLSSPLYENIEALGSALSSKIEGLCLAQHIILDHINSLSKP